MVSGRVGFLGGGWYAGHLNEDPFAKGNHGCKYCGGTLHGKKGSWKCLRACLSIYHPSALSKLAELYCKVWRCDKQEKSGFYEIFSDLIKRGQNNNNENS